MKVKTRGLKRKTRRPEENWKFSPQLPADYPWKVLGYLHNDLAHILTEDDNALLSQIIRDRDFASYCLLSEEWGLQNQSISSCSTGIPRISYIRARYQLSALLKKFRFKTDKDAREASALKKFYDAEAACRDFNHSGYMSLSWGETEKDACVFTHARSFLKKLLGDRPVLQVVMTRWSRHGPGSNLDTRNGQSNIYFKYSNWPYSCTASAIPVARYLISTDKRWLGYLEDSYRRRFNIPKERILNRKVFWNSVLKVVKGNRITFVPKDAQTERSIAIEPAMNLFLQLGVDGFIRQRLKRWDIDLDSQTKNQRLAMYGSVDPTSRSYATLDLSAASDSLSLKLCELLLPYEWYYYLCKLRSPQGKLGDEVIHYEKISSMGNGFTFALESAIFAALCYGAIKAFKGHCDFKTDLSVFGDDIIVRSEMVSKVVRSLNNAGFKLNIDKSFTSGFVKESCGTDWVHGKPVRPIFFKDFPVDINALFTDYNRIKRMLFLRFGIEESLTLNRIKGWIPEKYLSITGPYSDDEFDSHLHVHMPSGHMYKNCLWLYPRLVKKPCEVRCNDFLGRKLMHDLRGRSPSPFYESKRVDTTGGSRFTVYKSYSYTVRKTYSVADIWRSDYTEETLGLAAS